MKKFKVLEESRFLDKNAYGNFKGGKYITVCGSERDYKACGFLGDLTTCGTALTVGGYQTGLCNNVEFYESCSGTGILYTVSNCYGGDFFTTTCGGSNVYKI